MVNNKYRFYLAAVIATCIAVVVIPACNKPEVQIGSETAKVQRELKYASSVAMINGAYKIDTNIILANRNKKTLVAALLSEKLVDKNSTSEIPGFIKAFLTDAWYEKEFSMANANEKYQEGWFDLGKGIPTKQLIYFSLGKNIALFSYYSGGIRRHQHILLIKFEENKIIDFWFDNSDLDVRSKEELMEYLKTNRTASGRC